MKVHLVKGFHIGLAVGELHRAVRHMYYYIVYGDQKAVPESTSHGQYRDRVQLCQLLGRYHDLPIKRRRSQHHGMNSQLS